MARVEVYLAHAHDDRHDAVRRLEAALTERGLLVWNGATEVRPGQPLRARLDSGLRASALCAVVVTEAVFSGDREWLLYELRAWRQVEARLQRSDRIIPVLCGDRDELLRQLETSDHPIAAELREIVASRATGNIQEGDDSQGFEELAAGLHERVASEIRPSGSALGAASFFATGWVCVGLAFVLTPMSSATTVVALGGGAWFWGRALMARVPESEHGNAGSRQLWIRIGLTSAALLLLLVTAVITDGSRLWSSDGGMTTPSLAIVTWTAMLVGLTYLEVYWQHDIPRGDWRYWTYAKVALPMTYGAVIGCWVGFALAVIAVAGA